LVFIFGGGVCPWIDVIIFVYQGRGQELEPTAFFILDGFAKSSNVGATFSRVWAWVEGNRGGQQGVLGTDYTDCTDGILRFGNQGTLIAKTLRPPPAETIK